MVGDTISVTSGSQEFDAALTWLEGRGIGTYGTAAVVAERVSPRLSLFHLIRNPVICHDPEMPFESVNLGHVEVDQAPRFFLSPAERVMATGEGRMKLDDMTTAFAEAQEVGYDVFGQLTDDSPRIHFEIRFTGPGEASTSKVDERELPELATEVWSVIERDGNDDGVETFLAGFLVGHLHAVGVPA